MTNIFMCYHRTEFDLAIRLKDRLAASGHTVFIDRAIRPGTRWAEEIEHALEGAAFVVVLLSEASVHRDFVKEEARRAHKKGIPLFPVRVQFNGELPYELGAILGPIQHAAWTSPADDDELLRHIEAHLDRITGKPAAVLDARSTEEPLSSGTSLLTDNWLLQDAAACIQGYFSSNHTIGLDVDPAGQARLVNLPAGGVQLEALISLLTEIVLREELVVEQHFAHAWRSARCLAPVRAEGIIRAVDFRKLPELQVVRQYELEMLCVTPSLRTMQAENERRWNESNQKLNLRSSAIIWGTAGYLARAHLHQMVYSGHPLRRRFIAQTLRFPQGEDAKAHLDEWLEKSRVRLFEAALPDGGESRRATFLVPPIAVQIIENCSRLEELIPTALQVRRQYTELRGWLSAYQRALDDGEPRALLKHRRDLIEAAKDMERQLQGDSRFGSSQVELNVDWHGGTPLLGTRVSARSILSNLLFTKKGESSLRRLLKLLGEERSLVGRQAMDHLRERSIWHSSRTKISDASRFQ